MSIHIQATFKDGVIYPTEPLNLPNDTVLGVEITPISQSSASGEESSPNLPKSPRFTPQELADRINKYGVSVGSLPADFSRADIYDDHD